MLASYAFCMRCLPASDRTRRSPPPVSPTPGWSPSANQRDAYAAGATQVAARNAVLLMAGFTKIPGVFDGIAEDDLRRRFHGWELRT
jgi:hypothetical protein